MFHLDDLKYKNLWNFNSCILFGINISFSVVAVSIFNLVCFSELDSLWQFFKWQNGECGNLRTVCWGEYFNRKERKCQEVGENLLLLLLLLLLLDNKIKEQEMGGTCKMHEKTEKCMQIMVRKYKRVRPLPRSGHR